MALSDLIDDARSIFRAALEGVEPDFLLQGVRLNGLSGRPLDSFRRRFVVGGGKASMVMAGAVEEQVGEYIDGGLVIVPHGYPDTFPDTVQLPERIDVLEAAHPVPDRVGVEATGRLLELCRACTEEDLLIVLISGGGSALLPAFAGDISLEDAQALYQLLLESGADIYEMNTVRKHCSAISGGQLARAAAPATLQTLVISDVVGNDLSVVSSGPTVPDASTFREAVDVLQKYEIWDRLPSSIRRHLERGLNDSALETPKEEDPIFDRVNTVLLGSNRDALKGARKEALERGYRTEIEGENITGEAEEVGLQLVKTALQEEGAGPVCLLWGGETTVTIHGSGTGGRNQELTLAAAIEMDKNNRSMVLLSGGTDGVDGPTDAAGAWATPETAHQARTKGLVAERYLADNNAYTFFDAVDGLVKTGPTHTNVMDVQIVLVDLE